MFQYEYPRAASTASVIVWKRISEQPNCITIIGIRRLHEPYKNYTALAGGFHNPGQENLLETAKRELCEELALDIELGRFELVTVQSEIHRDPRDHIIDHVYSVEIYPDEFINPQAGDDAESVYYELICLNRPDTWQLDKWAFDHGSSIRIFLSLLSL